MAELTTMTYEVTDRVARITFNRPDALLNSGVATSQMISTVFDGIARHTPEGHAFVADAGAHGFREAARRRDAPFGDHGRRTSGV